MKINRFIFTCALSTVLIGQLEPALFEPASLRAQEPAGEGEQAAAILSRAVATMNRRPAVAAKLRERIDLYNQQLVGSGLYLQQAADGHRRLRLELRIQLDDRAATLLQVSDGQSFWVFRDLGGQTSLTRIELSKVAEARGRAAAELPLGTLPAPLSLGGLPQLLESLANQYEFSEMEEGVLEEQDVLVLTGRINVARLGTLLPPAEKEGEGGIDFKKLPPHMPDSVQLTLGRDDLFPYRIEFFRSENPGPAPPRTLVALEFFEVQLEPEINAQEFIYQPGPQSVEDGTEAYLRSVGLRK